MTLSDREFEQFRRFIYDAAGISLAPGKKALVSGRLAKRLQHCGVASYDAYFKLLAGGSAPDETQTAIDLLTTNETYFFREAKHFDHLRDYAEQARSTPFRVWSAASSTGEEAYSIAMVLGDCLDGQAWEVVGTDISTRVLQRARSGHYSMARANHIPPAYLRRFCLKGHGPQEGTLLIDRLLRQRVRFVQANLNAPLPQLGLFDAVFLRNVLIYFNAQTKREVVARVLSLLKPGGHFYVGHSESLNGICETVRAVGPAIYVRT